MAVVLAALVSVGLFVDGVLALPGEGLQGAGFGRLVLLSVSPWLLATAYGWLAWAVHRRRATARRMAAVLAAVVVTGGLFAEVDVTGGALVAMVAVGLALLIAVEPSVRDALVRPASPVASARLLVGWWTVGAVYAMVFAFVQASDGSEDAVAPSAPTAAGVLFLLLAGAGVATLAAVERRVGLIRWVFAAALMLDVVAVAFVDAGEHLLWPLLCLHAAAVLALIVPGRARRHFGEEPLAAARAVGERWNTLLDSPRSWVLGGSVGLVLLTGVVIGLASLSTASEYGSDYSTGTTSTVGTIGAVVVALLCVAAMFTPTMPAWWRAMLGGGAVLALGAAFTSHHLVDDPPRFLALMVLLPAMLVGSSVWGAWVNHQNGATSARPGWVGPGGPPPASAPRFPLPPTAGGRSRIQLQADIALDPEAALAAVQRMCAIRGNWFLVGSDRVVCGPADGTTVRLVIGTGGTGHAQFRARAWPHGPRTTLRVGCLDRWTSRRSYYGYLIPAGPAHVLGFFMYKLFLQTVASEIKRLDPTAHVTFGAAVEER